ncbi:MAG: hypothetical protein ACJA0S_001326 [Rickettsiales bacterium]|jgi:hypothetical protein
MREEIKKDDFAKYLFGKISLWTNNKHQLLVIVLILFKAA